MSPLDAALRSFGLRSLLLDRYLRACVGAAAEGAGGGAATTARAILRHEAARALARDAAQHTPRTPAREALRGELHGVLGAGGDDPFAGAVGTLPRLASAWEAAGEGERARALRSLADAALAHRGDAAALLARMNAIDPAAPRRRVARPSPVAGGYRAPLALAASADAPAALAERRPTPSRLGLAAVLVAVSAAAVVGAVRGLLAYRAAQRLARGGPSLAPTTTPPPPSAAVGAPPVAAGRCVVDTAASFHLRPAPTPSRAGAAAYPAGERLAVGEPTDVWRGDNRLFRVVVLGDGASGYAFLTPAERARCGLSGAPPAAPAVAAPSAVVARPARVSASSWYQGRRREFSPWLAFDNDLRTAWNDGVPGSPVGEWIEAGFDRPRRLRRVRFSTGWDAVSRRGDDLFLGNARIRVATIAVDGVTVATVEAAPWERSRSVALDVTGSSLRITASAVHDGARWQDVCVSEVIVEADP